MKKMLANPETKEDHPMTRRISIMFSAGTLMIGLIGLPAFAQDSQWRPVAEALGKAGTEMPRGVYRVGMP